MAVSLAKGAMRVVGGQLSHAGEATVNAGNATIGIRGGTGIFTTKEAININGTLTPSDCPPVKRPGYKISLWCGPIQQVTSAELSHYANLFTSRFGQNGGVPGLTNANLNAFGMPAGWSLRIQLPLCRREPILTTCSSKRCSTAPSPVCHRRRFSHRRRPAWASA
jgi:hypothetical protein